MSNPLSLQRQGANLKRRVAGGGGGGGAGQLYFDANLDAGVLDPNILVKWTGTESIVNSPDGVGKALLLRTVSNTGGSGAPNSQMACVYMNDPNSRGREGMRSVYRSDLWLPSNHQPTVGQWNFMQEWHISDAVPQNGPGTRAASSGLALWSQFTDRNTGIQYGDNTWVMVLRMMGGDPADPYGSDVNSPGTYRVLGPMSSYLGKYTPFYFDIFWSQFASQGFCECWQNGSMVWRYNGPTLFRLSSGDSDAVGWGLYNYHPSISYQSDVYYKNWRMGSTVSSVL